MSYNNQNLYITATGESIYTYVDDLVETTSNVISNRITYTSNVLVAYTNKTSNNIMADVNTKLNNKEDKFTPLTPSLILASSLTGSVSTTTTTSAELGTFEGRISTNTAGITALNTQINIAPHPMVAAIPILDVMPFYELMGTTAVTTTTNAAAIAALTLGKLDKSAFASRALDTGTGFYISPLFIDGFGYVQIDLNTDDLEFSGGVAGVGGGNGGIQLTQSFKNSKLDSSVVDTALNHIFPFKSPMYIDAFGVLQIGLNNDLSFSTTTGEVGISTDFKNSKQNTIQTSDTDKVVISATDKNITTSTITKSELECLSGTTQNIKQSFIDTSNYISRFSGTNIAQSFIDTSNYVRSTSNILQTQINGKANTTHTHQQSDIIGLSQSFIDTSNYVRSTSNLLQTQINGKANTTHTHQQSDIIGLSQSFVDTSNYVRSTSNILQTQINTKQNNITAGTGLSFLGNTLSFVPYAGADTRWATVNTNDIYLNTTGGVLGIGTNAPAASYQLHCHSTLTANAGMTMRLGVATSGADIFLQGSTGDLVFYNRLAGQVRFGTNNTQRMCILSNGNVGIGTISPLGNLTISGVSTITSVTNTTGNIVLINNDALSGNPNTIGSSIVFSQRYWSTTDIIAVGMITGVKIANTGNYGGGLTFWTGTPGQNSMSEKLRILDSGNIGVGITNPSAKFQVNGGAVNFTNTSPSAVPLGYMSAGSLTIGDTLLDYGGGTTGWSTNTAGLLLECLNNTEIAVHDANNRVASLMYYEGGTTNRLQIGRDPYVGTWGTISNISLWGNVGIGTTSAGYALDVYSGGTYIARFRHTNNTQGIAFSYWTIEPDGTNVDQDLGIKAKGAGYLRLYTGGLERTNINQYGTMSHSADMNLNGNYNFYFTRTSTLKWRLSAGPADLSNEGNFNFDIYQISTSTWYNCAYIEDDRSWGVQMNFTGQHRCCSEDKTIYSSNYNGLLVSCTGKYKNIGSKYGKNNIKQNITTNDALPYVELTSRAYDPNVYGILTDRTDDEEGKYKSGAFVSNWKKDGGDDRCIVNGCGEGALWVCNYNSNLKMGDYLCSSPISGLGMKQDDDLLHNYTVAKITMDCDFEPHLIPVEVIKQEPYDYWGTSNINDVETPILCTATSNVVDENGYPVYEYKRDENNEIVYDFEYEVKTVMYNDIEYKMAFVGCTYKCS